MLVRATELSPDDVLAGLEAAGEAQILVARSDNLSHGFAHPLFCALVYDLLPVKTRAELHARIGRALEHAGSRRWDQLAYHFHHAFGREHYARAARYGARAGDAAMQAYGYTRAAEYYGWASDALTELPSTDVDDHLEVLLKRVFALVRAGQARQARRCCKQAMRLAEEHARPELLVRAARLLRPSVSVAQLPDPLAVKTLEHALEKLPAEATADRARAYSQLACLPPYAWNLEESGRMSAEALRIARELNDPELLLDALRSRLRGLSGPGDIDALCEVADEIVRRSEGRAYWYCTDALHARYHAALLRGDPEQAEASLAAFGRQGERQRVHEWIWHHEQFRAQRVFDAGDVDTAERAFEALWAEARQLNLSYVGAYEIVHRDALAWAREVVHGAAWCGDAPPEVFQWAKDLPAHQVRLLRLALSRGDRDMVARGLHEMAENRFAVLTRDASALASLARLSLVAVELNEREIGQTLHELLAPHADLIAVNGFSQSLGSVHYYLGKLNALCERWGPAHTSFEAAMAANARARQHLHEYEATLALAEALAESGRAADRRRARGLAAQVEAAAKTFGATRMARAAAALM